MQAQRWALVAIGCGAVFFFGIVRGTCSQRAAERERDQARRDHALVEQALQDYQVAQAKPAHNAIELAAAQPSDAPSGITADLSAYDYEAAIATKAYWIPATTELALPNCRLAIAVTPPRFTVTETCGNSTKTARGDVGAKARPLPHGKGSIALKQRVHSVHTVGRLSFEINAGFAQEKNASADKNLETVLFKNADAQLAIAAIPDGYPTHEITNAFIEGYDNSEACTLAVGKETLACTRAFDGSERIELFIFRSQAQRVAVRFTYQSDQYDRAIHHVVPTLASLLP